MYNDDIIEPLTPNHLVFGRRLAQTNIHPDEISIDGKINMKWVRYIETVVESY